MHDDSKEQEMLAQGWRPAGYRAPDEAERQFFREHPGWLAAAWAHPDWQEWNRKRDSGLRTPETGLQPPG